MIYYHSQGFRGEDTFDQKLMTKDCQFNCYRSNISLTYGRFEEGYLILYAKNISSFGKRIS